MRIAFDGRAFDSPAGGVRRYATELVAALRTVAPGSPLVAVGGVQPPAGMTHTRARSPVPTNLGWCLSGLPIAARQTAFDVFHAPAYTAPLWGVRPLVVTIHDVSYARRPEWSPHPRGVGPTRRWFYRASAHRADRIVTDSTFSQSEITAAYGIPGERIDVVPLGVSPIFSADGRTATDAIVLHVGDLHPRRNLAMLLDVVIGLRRAETGLSALRLVLAGSDLGVLDSLRAQAAASGMPGVLEYIGRPDDETLAGWYRRAAVFAYPSRYEGFGLPLLEAMASGAPVVASNAASIPEVAGEAGVLVPPEAAREWAEALRAVLLDEERRRALSALGISRAAQFTWTRTAELTLAVYERAIHQTGDRRDRR